MITEQALGGSPFGVAGAPCGHRIYVTNQGGNTVSVITRQ